MTTPVVILIYSICAATLAMSVGFLLAPEASYSYKSMLTACVFASTFYLYN